MVQPTPAVDFPQLSEGVFQVYAFWTCLRTVTAGFLLFQIAEYTYCWIIALVAMAHRMLSNGFHTRVHVGQRQLIYVMYRSISS